MAGANAQLRGMPAPVICGLVALGALVAGFAGAGALLLAIGCALALIAMVCGIVLRRRRLRASRSLGGTVRLGMMIATTNRGRLLVFRSIPGGDAVSALSVDRIASASSYQSGAFGILVLRVRSGETVRFGVSRPADGRDLVAAIETTVLGLDQDPH